MQNEKGATAKDTVIEDADSTGSTDDVDIYYLQST